VVTPEERIKAAKLFEQDNKSLSTSKKTATKTSFA
jgi:hypothetical protein